jgi:NodT family efflux transporter outer membrane factor (OMF) lipoprotein
MECIVTRCAFAFIVLSATGCMVGPDYVRPSVDTPAAYKELLGSEDNESREGHPGWKRAEPGDAIARGKWWEVFGDPELSALAERVDIKNQNIREAEARFRQANALARQARAGLFPLVGGSASAARVRRSGQESSPAASYEIALDAAWELDVWGRVRRSIESAEASWQASAADLESVRLSAQAALAQSYIALRVADAQRQLFEDTVAAYSRSLELTQNRYAAGTAAKADVVLAQVQLLSAQADLLDIGVARAQLEHAIALLIGEPASTFSIPPAPIVAAMPATPVGVPSELLERRPDIATAERNVAAANAQIGVAQAAFYPSLTLSATGGYGSAELARLVSTPNQFWSLGAALAQTLFDAGARRALSDRAIAAYDAEVAFYRQTVLAAFQDVEDNLAALRILEEEARVQDEVVRGARHAVELTTNQYKAGIVSYLNVIAAQTIALNNERTAVNLLGRRLAASVALVRALGGGWSADVLEQYRVSRLGR